MTKRNTRKPIQWQNVLKHKSLKTFRLRMEYILPQHISCHMSGLPESKTGNTVILLIYMLLPRMFYGFIILRKNSASVRVWKWKQINFRYDRDVCWVCVLNIWRCVECGVCVYMLNVCWVCVCMPAGVPRVGRCVARTSGEEKRTCFRSHVLHHETKGLLPVIDFLCAIWNLVQMKQQTSYYLCGGDYFE